MIEQSEKVEIDILTDKWSELGDLCSNSTTSNETLRNSIIPCIARFGLKKSFEQKLELKCKFCRNKLVHGINIEDATKNRMSHDTSCIDLRDRGSLMWPSKIIITLSGVILKLFERFVQSENLMNDCFASCSSCRVSMPTLKSLVHDMMLQSPLKENVGRVALT